MWDASSQRLVVHLPPSEAERLLATCTMSCIRSPACWMRHAIFGDPVVRVLDRTDAAVADGLRRLTDRAVMLHAIVRRSRAATAVKDKAVVAIGALADRIRIAESRLTAPYAAGTMPWISGSLDGHSKAVGCVASEREVALVQREAKRMGLTRSKWLHAVLVEGGLPEPILPHYDDGAVDALRAMLVVVQGLIKAENAAGTAAEIGRMLEFNAKTFGGAMDRLSGMAKDGAA